MGQLAKSCPLGQASNPSPFTAERLFWSGQKLPAKFNLFSVQNKDIGQMEKMLNIKDNPGPLFLMSSGILLI